MAQFITEIPDEKIQSLTDLICDQLRYDTESQEDETKIQFAKRMHRKATKEWIRGLKQDQQYNAIDVGDNDFEIS